MRADLFNGLRYCHVILLQYFHLIYVMLNINSELRLTGQTSPPGVEIVREMAAFSMAAVSTNLVAKP